MSIFGGIRSAVTGLAAQSQSLGMIADNIANVNTVGYKGANARFSTLVTVQATQSQYSPGGVRSNVLRNIDQQGLLEASSSSTDIAVAGNGFFVVNENPDGSGTTLFTRAGSFRPDQNGNLVNASGYYLMGWPIIDGTVAQTNVLSAFSIVNVSNISSTPQPSQNVSIGANLPSEAEDGDEFDIAVQLFDRQGGPHLLTLTYTKTATPNEWTLSGTIGNALFDDGATGDANVTLGTLTFNADGTLGTVTPTPGITALDGDNLVFTLDYDSDLGTGDDQVTVSLDLGSVGAANGMTQFAGAFNPRFIEQDGRQSGFVAGTSIAEDGTVTVQFSNGDSRDIFQIPLVIFNNPSGLIEKSGNAYIESSTSGTPTAHAPGTGGAGAIASSTLEASTVDIADEFTRMIITQRAFSANTRVITTGDQMLDELVRIVR